MLPAAGRVSWWERVCQLTDGLSAGLTSCRLRWLIVFVSGHWSSLTRRSSSVRQSSASSSTLRTLVLSTHKRVNQWLHRSLRCGRSRAGRPQNLSRWRTRCSDVLWWVWTHTVLKCYLLLLFSVSSLHHEEEERTWTGEIIRSIYAHRSCWSGLFDVLRFYKCFTFNISWLMLSSSPAQWLSNHSWATVRCHSRWVVFRCFIF